MPSWEELSSEALSIEGAVGFALGDWTSGACLAFKGTEDLVFPERDLPLVVTGDSEVIRTQLKLARSLNFKPEEILIIIKKQYDLIRLINFRGLFIYLALDREKGNLAMARIKLSQIADKIEKLLAHKLKSARSIS
jgi:hypothetical protein